MPKRQKAAAVSMRASATSQEGVGGKVDGSVKPLSKKVAPNSAAKKSNSVRVTASKTPVSLRKAKPQKKTKASARAILCITGVENPMLGQLKDLLITSRMSAQTYEYVAGIGIGAVA